MKETDFEIRSGVDIMRRFHVKHAFCNMRVDGIKIIPITVHFESLSVLFMQLQNVYISLQTNRGERRLLCSLYDLIH